MFNSSEILFDRLASCFCFAQKICLVKKNCCCIEDHYHNLILFCEGNHLATNKGTQDKMVAFAILHAAQHDPKLQSLWVCNWTFATASQWVCTLRTSAVHNFAMPLRVSSSRNYVALVPVHCRSHVLSCKSNWLAKRLWTYSAHVAICKGLQVCVEHSVGRLARVNRPQTPKPLRMLRLDWYGF